MPVVTIGAQTGADFGGVADAQIKEGAATTNYGSGNDIEVTKYDSGDWTTTLIAFSGLSNIPSGSTINAASIFLYQSAADIANGTYVVSAKRLLRAWVEAQATWNIWATSNNWTTGGAFGDATDRVATVSGATAGLDLATGAYKELVLNSTGLADVSGFVNGSLSNYGWMLERTDASNDFGFRTFRSSDWSTAAQRPYLSVDYTAPSAAIPPGRTIYVMP